MDGVRTGVFRNAGEEEGQILSPFDVTITEAGEVGIAEEGNDRIQFLQFDEAQLDSTVLAR